MKDSGKEREREGKRERERDRERDCDREKGDEVGQVPKITERNRSAHVRTVEIDQQ